eukprot:214148-Amphidinium_carterae.1
MAYCLVLLLFLLLLLVSHRIHSPLHWRGQYPVTLVYSLEAGARTLHYVKQRVPAFRCRRMGKHRLATKKGIRRWL